jgi:23S rRNA pseudouridine1911/1915/1917 synthase
MLNEILYEDNHLIAINKLPGQLVQGDKTGDDPVSEDVKTYIRERYKKPGNVFLGTIHRLDRPVSGVVLFARTSKALERMNELFRSREIEKTYWAIVTIKPPESTGKLIHFLSKNESKNKSRAFDSEKINTSRCELDYRLLSESDRYYLLEVKPLTGRHHQIRVQLSATGFPIKGDLKYGAPRSNPDGSICLHARKLEFIHPVSGEKINIIADPPDEKLWNFFKASAGN